MTKFNDIQKHSTKTETYEGGQAYTKALEDEWINALFSSVLQSKFYESDETQQSRFIELTELMIQQYGPEFVSKAAVFSRNELGMRSISELTAAILNSYQWETKRSFYSKYFHRPDGVGEVFAAIDHLGNKRSHALVRGAGDYISSLNAYQLGKYPMRKHKYNMHDIINITHAKSSVVDRYQKGVLESPDTWEVNIHSAKTSEERENEWKRLVEEHKLGYLALLRNLRNICKCSFADDAWINDNLISQIVNKEAIKKSLVWPMQIYSAWKILNSKGVSLSIEQALSEAFKLATSNMPYLEGDTLVVLDVSGSMEYRFSQNSSLTIKEVSAVYAAAFLTSEFKSQVDFIKFGSKAKYISNEFTSENVFMLIKKLSDNDRCGYGTEIASVFNLITKHYDRILLFSDMQVMDAGRNSFYYEYSAQNLWDKYCKEYGSSHIYSFDLGNYSIQIVSRNSSISYITALNDIVFKIISIQEEGKSLIDIIKQYSF